MEDDEKFKKRQSTGLKKSKSNKLANKRPKLDSRQYAMFAGGVILMAWGITATIFLLNIGFMYTFGTIPMTREVYSTKGAASWAKEVASKDVMQAIEVWNLINASITGLVYRSPQDYTNLGNVISPAFETMPLLHSVELAFSDRTSQVSMTRRKSPDPTESASFMQSNSADCFLMGVQGCAGQTGSSAVRPDWYDFGLSLNPTPYGGVFYWAQQPELVVESTPEEGDSISPTIRLVFKVAFPTFRAPTGANILVVGRITLKLAKLGGPRLVDSRLGDDGKVYLCDATGIVLAAEKWQDVLIVDDGIVRFRNFWEVGSWGGKVRSAFTGSSVREMKTDASSDGTFVAVEPLDNPLARFAIIVVAPSTETFRNSALVGTAAVASVVGPAPYVITGTMAFFFLCGQCIQTMRKIEPGGGIEAMESTTKGRGRVSITETTRRTSVSDVPEGKEKELKSMFGGGMAAARKAVARARSK